MSTWIVALIAAAVLVIIAVAIVATVREDTRRAARVVAVTPRPVIVPGLDDTSAVPLVVTCPWCPIAPEDGASDEAARDDCTCPEPCGEPWCGQLRVIRNWSGA